MQMTYLFTTPGFHRNLSVKAHEMQLTFDPAPCMIDDDDSITGHLCYHPRLNHYASGSASFTRRERVTRPRITPQCCHQPWLRPCSISIYLDVITVVHT